MITKQQFQQQVNIGRPQFYDKAVQKLSNAHWDLFGKEITKRRMLKFWRDQNSELELKKTVCPTEAYLYEKKIADNNEIISQIQSL